MTEGNSLAQVRARRDRARKILLDRLGGVRTSLSPNAIKADLASKARRETAEALETALDVAAESKGIIAATAAAIVLWFLRNPIIAWIDAQFNATQEQE